MAKIDPEQERKRLADFYSRQLDGRLEKVAGEAYELSDLAKEVLKAELVKRGLSVELAKRAPVPIKKTSQPLDPQTANADGAKGELVTIRQFRDLPEALLAKGSLDSAGIKCALVDDNVVRMDWFWSNAMGGVKLLVDQEEVAAAEEILAQPIPEQFDVSGVGEYEQPRCPRCFSLDINFQGTAPVSYVVKIPIYRHAWRCRACDLEWEDNSAKEYPASPD